MAVKQLTPEQEIHRYLDEQLERRKKAIINMMAYVGESCLKAARELNTYMDRTGNLRSSTGYAIVVDGKVFTKSAFKQESPKGQQKLGATYTGGSQGSQFIDSISNQYPSGIVLVVVAGMDYAAYVQDYGFDVLDSAELVAERMVPQLLKQLGLK